MKFGVDLSTWNPDINYDEVVNNIAYAIIRVGYGVSYMPDKQKDEMFEPNYNGLKGRIPLGAYYYAYATDYDSGRKEAENCLSYMGEKKFELPIFYDLEESRNTREAAEGFIARIREAGLKAGLYTYTSMYEDKGLVGIDCDCLWLAEWGANNGEVPSSEPDYNFDIWQYTSKGYVGGIDGRVDCNLAKDYVINGVTPGPGPSPEPPSPSYPLLYNGCQGDSVRYLQDKLLEKGYSLPNYGADSYYGNETEEAVRQLQADAGIGVDGICGNDTWNVINSDFHRPDRPAYPGYLIEYGCQGEDVRRVQDRLQEIGYDCGWSGGDGIFGDDTLVAVKRFQRDNGLIVDGIVGKLTWDKLF